MGSDTSDKATADAAARAEATSTTAALGVDKKRKAKRRVPRATVVTIMSAIIAFIIAQNVPELVISTIKPLPINTTRTSTDNLLRPLVNMFRIRWERLLHYGGDHTVDHSAQ